VVCFLFILISVPERGDRASSKSGSRDDHPIIKCQGAAGEQLHSIVVVTEKQKTFFSYNRNIIVNI
jgi:hypothetical protein